MLGHVSHPYNLLFSIPFPYLDMNLGTSEKILYAKPTCVKGNSHHDRKPLYSSKVKKSPKASSTPYNRSESKLSKSNACLNIIKKNCIWNWFDEIDVKKYATRPFKCNICNRAFTKKYYLSGHIWLHTESKSYRCSECPKVFMHKSSMVAHENTHYGGFKCSLCDRRCSSKSELKRHFAMHIPERTGEIYYNDLRCSWLRHKPNI